MDLSMNLRESGTQRSSSATSALQDEVYGPHFNLLCL